MFILLQQVVLLQMKSTAFKPSQHSMWWVSYLHSICVNEKAISLKVMQKEKKIEYISDQIEKFRCTIHPFSHDNARLRYTCHWHLNMQWGTKETRARHIIFTVIEILVYVMAQENFIVKFRKVEIYFLLLWPILVSNIETKFF